MDILTVRHGNSWVTWKVSPECRRTIEPIAAEFGMSVERFLEKFSFDRLPAQLPSRDFCEDQDEEVDLNLDILSLSHSKQWPRIVRAARSEGLTVEEFLTEAIMDDVHACEEAFILSPRTGEPIANAYQLRDFIIDEQYAESGNAES